MVSAVMVQLSQPHNRMDSTSNLYSFILVGKLISMLFQILLNFAMADVAVAILILIYVVERPSLVRVALRYLKASTSSSCCPHNLSYYAMADFINTLNKLYSFASAYFANHRYAY